MASLTGQKIKDTYQSLLKTDDNGLITNAFKGVTDGSGNASGLYLKNGGVQVNGTLIVSGSLLYSGSTIDATVTSASYALTASYALNGGGGGSINTSSFATTGSNIFIGEQTISGSIQISGSIIPATDGISTTSSFDLGSATNAWKDIWVSNGTINFLDGAGNVQATLASNEQGLILPEALNFSSSVVQSVPTSSGDGSGLSTLQLKPDENTGDNRYIVLDPTGPNHIHIRAGGIIDQSSADLIIGGENTSVLVSDALQNVQIKTTNAEVEFIGSIDNGFGDGPGATLHVTDVINGTITDGMTIYGPGIPGGYTLQFGTVIAPQGDGGVGNYYLPGGDFLTTPSTYVGGAITASNWTFGADGIIKLNNGIAEIHANPDNGLVRIATAPVNVAPNTQITLGGPSEAFKIRFGPPLRQWTFETSGDFTLSGSINLSGSVNGATNLATTGSNTFVGEQIISGSLIVTGGITGSVNAVPTLYLLEAYANETYTLPGGFVDDTCRYSIVNNTVNVPSNWFNTSSYTFTPQKAGYWEITATYDIYRNSEASMAIRKNGAVVAAGGSFGAVAQQVTKIVYLNGSTDYVDAMNTGGASNSRSQFDSRSWFQARWIGE